MRVSRPRASETDLFVVQGLFFDLVCCSNKKNFWLQTLICSSFSWLLFRVSHVCRSLICISCFIQNVIRVRGCTRSLSSLSPHVSLSVVMPLFFNECGCDSSLTRVVELPVVVLVLVSLLYFQIDYPVIHPKVIICCRHRRVICIISRCHLSLCSA